MHVDSFTTYLKNNISEADVFKSFQNRAFKVSKVLDRSGGYIEDISSYAIPQF